MVRGREPDLPHAQPEPDPFAIYAHLAEVVGGLSVIGNASRRRKPTIDPITFVPKVMAWWMALCGRIGILNVEDMIWSKYPAACTYCIQPRHDPAGCARAKAVSRMPDWDKLKVVGANQMTHRPSRLGGWVLMFGEIYPPEDENALAAGFSRLAEEMGELAETLRYFHITPGYFLSEAADVFAWLMNIQIRIFWGQGMLDSKEWAGQFSADFEAAYPDACADCGQLPCQCQPVLPESIGRLAHEGPPDAEKFFGPGLPIPAAEIARLLQVKPRTVQVGNRELAVDHALLVQVQESMEKLMPLLVASELSSSEAVAGLATAAQKIDRLAARQELTQQAIDDLAGAIAQLQPSDRGVVLDFFTSMAAGTWTQALINGVERLVQ